MGLNEKRKMAQLQQTAVPAFNAQVQEICTKPVTVEVDLASLANDMPALNLIERLAFAPILAGLRQVASDKIGVDALAAGLKVIQIGNVAAAADAKLTFVDGTLSMIAALALQHDGNFVASEIAAVLTPKL